MNPSSKKKLVAVIVVVVAIVVIGFVAWYSRPNTVPSGSTASSGSVVASGTPGSSSLPAQTTTPSGGISVATTSITTTPVPAATSTSWQSITSKTVGVTFSVPPGWAIGPDAPISMDNFNHQYQGDSIIPMGGAEIDVASTHYYGTTDGLIKNIAVNGTVNTTSSVAVDGVLCAEVFYSSTYAAGYPSSNVAAYCQSSGSTLLYEMYLSYRTGDPQGTQHVATFGQFLNRMQFIAQ